MADLYRAQHGQLHETTAIPDSETSADAGCPCDQPCAGRLGGRERTSSQLPMPRECLSCPRCPSGCGSPHQCSLQGERVKAGPRCPGAPCSPATELSKVQVSTCILSCESMTDQVTSCMHYLEATQRTQTQSAVLKNQHVSGRRDYIQPV